MKRAQYDTYAPCHITSNWILIVFYITLGDVGQMSINNHWALCCAFNTINELNIICSTMRGTLFALIR